MHLRWDGIWVSNSNCFFGITESIALTAGATAAEAASAASTVSTIGSIASIASAGVGALGAIQSSEAQSNTAKYNASVAAANATMAKQSAAYAGAAGAAQSEQASLQTRAKVGGIEAAQAAGNIDVNSGSALDVRSSASQLGELNALSVRSNAARTSYGYQVQAANDTAQSQLDTYGASTASTAGDISAFGTVLGGVGNAASNYAKFQLASGNSLNSGSDNLFQTTNFNQYNENPTGTPGY
jgi:hypothetical protein